MASEITHTTTLSAAKGGAEIDSSTISSTVSMTGTQMGTLTQTITQSGTTATALDVGSCTGNVKILIYNLSSSRTATIYQQATVSGAVTLSTLLPQDHCKLVGVPYNKLFCDLDASGTALLQYWVCEQ